jgi:hypothetical protein
MKKIYSLLTAVMITTVSFAQTPMQGVSNAPTKAPAKIRSFDRNMLRANNTNALAKTSSTGNSAWFNYGNAMVDFIGSTTSEINSNYLFPDSMGYGNFGGTPGPIWIHHLAELVDFRSMVFAGATLPTNFVSLNPTAPNKIDSMSIVYAYTRNHPNPNITDTLVVTVYNNATAANLPGAYFTGATALNYSTDTLSIKLVKYTQATNVVNATGKYVFKVLLTGADTAVTSYREKAFKLPVPFTNAGGKLAVGSVAFRPGYTYTLTQDVDATANTFLFASLEESGAGTFPTFFDCNANSAACDFSDSYILTQDVRYNMSTGWNGYFIPTYAYTAAYGFERHLISFHLTDDMTTGVNQLAASTADFVLGQNEPNPFSAGSLVYYQLPKEANTALFTVTDITGRIISSEKVATAAGTHTIKLGSYAAGVYYYSLNVDGNVTTKKMIAQ